MRTLAPVIFSKSFGGKIEHDQTNVNKENNFNQKFTQYQFWIFFLNLCIL